MLANLVVGHLLEPLQQGRHRRRRDQTPIDQMLPKLVVGHLLVPLQLGEHRRRGDQTPSDEMCRSSSSDISRGPLQLTGECHRPR